MDRDDCRRAKAEMQDMLANIEENRVKLAQLLGQLLSSGRITTRRAEQRFKRADELLLLCKHALERIDARDMPGKCDDSGESGAGDESE